MVGHGMVFMGSHTDEYDDDDDDHDDDDLPLPTGPSTLSQPKTLCRNPPALVFLPFKQVPLRLHLTR